MNIVGSPDISVLDFLVAFNISLATPRIVITNNSSGPDLASCTWWYVITTPSNTPIHTGSQGSPDAIGVWGPITVPDVWPLFSNQIEFSEGNPYAVTLFVKDGANNVYFLKKTALIVRPNGNTCSTIGNFAEASVGVSVMCNDAKIKGCDTTNYAYRNVLAPDSTTNEWRLDYPMDVNGNKPDPAEETNVANVLLPVGYSAAGYQLYFGAISTYTLNPGVTLLVKYKFRNNFSVLCNIDLCPLVYQINLLYKKLKNNCGITEENGLKDKLIKIGTLLDLCFIGINQPLCNVDVPKLIEEIKQVGGFECNCFCGTGIAAQVPINTGSGCCPSTTPIWAYGTTANPANCATSGYFPASVYAPDGVTYIGMAYSASDIVSIMNNDADWIELGMAFNIGSCSVGFFPNPGKDIPSVIVGTGIGTGSGAGTTPPCLNNNQNYLAVLTDKCSSNPTITFPTDVTVKYSNSGTEYSLGVISNTTELLAALNAESHKPATFSYVVGSLAGRISILVHNSNCPSVSGLLYLYGSNDCGGGSGVIDVPVIDKDTDAAPAECPASYFPAYVYAPNGTTLLGNANNVTELIALINGNPAWNAYGTAAFNGSLCSVTFTAPVGTTIPDIIIDKSTACVGGTINVNIAITDPCGPPFGSLTLASFPCELFVDWNDGSGMHTLGTTTSKADLVVKLNADSEKPASVTVVDNALVASSVILNESNCTYTQIPLIHCDLGSSSYLLVGANSGNPINIGPLPSSQLAIDGTSMTYLGAVPPGGSTGKRWHTILIGNVLLDTNPSTGKVRFFDVSNPKIPVLITTVQLTTITGNNFTGNPQTSLTYDPGNIYESRYELYFPTDLNSYMSTSEVYVVETNTGTIWKISMTGGVLGGFQDNKLRGKCPRVIAGGKLFFSQDGDVEDFTAGSGVNVGYIVILDLSDFTSTGLSTKEIFLNQLRSVWAASFDGIDTIYFIGTDTNIITAAGLSVGIYSVSTDTVTSRLIHIGPPAYGYANKRANSCISGGKLFCVALKDNVTNAAFFWNIPTFGTSNTYVVFDAFPYAVSPLTITPVGNCYVAVTFIPGPINNPSYVVKYKIDATSASYLSFVQLTDAKMLYNIVPLPVVGYTPNSFV